MQLSPPEYCWAPVVAIAKAINDGVGDDVLNVYRTCLLNTPIHIEIFDNAQDQMWLAHQLRQDEAQKGSVAKPTPIQMIMDIVEAKKMLEKELNKSLGAEQFAAKWNEKLKMASCSEAMKPGLADAAMTAWQRASQDPDLRDLMLWQEQLYDPPVIDSV